MANSATIEKATMPLRKGARGRVPSRKGAMTIEDETAFNGQQQEGLVVGPGDQPETNSQQASGNAR